MAHDWIVVDTECYLEQTTVACSRCHIEWGEHLEMIKDKSLTEGDCQSIIEGHPK